MLYPSGADSLQIVANQYKQHLVTCDKTPNVNTSKVPTLMHYALLMMGLSLGLFLSFYMHVK